MKFRLRPQGFIEIFFYKTYIYKTYIYIYIYIYIYKKAYDIEHYSIIPQNLVCH